MTETISENFSENKRGRGRPPILDGFARLKSVKNLYLNVIQEHTESTYHNTLYLHHALSVLCDFSQGIERFHESGKPYKWLIGEGEGCRGKKSTILTELGRLHVLTNDDDDLKDLALWICENKPNTQVIVKAIRETRREIQKRRQP